MKRKHSDPKKALFICNTYYQLIVAIQLSLTIYEHYKKDLWLGNTCECADNVSSKLRESGVFRAVRLYDYNGEAAYGVASHIGERLKQLMILIERQKHGAILYDDIDDYDDIVFFNVTDVIFGVFDASVNRGFTPRLFRMEEGLVSCESNHGGYLYNKTILGRVRSLLRVLYGKSSIEKRIQGFYCFIPELCDEDFPYAPIKIPPIQDTRGCLVDLLRMIFDFYPEDGFPQKYIYFASNAETDFGSTIESELIGRLADSLGADKIIIKEHPRDKKHSFEKMGYAIVPNSYVPCEVSQLCMDNGSRIFLTMTSGSFLTVSALDDCQPQAYFVIPGSIDDIELPAIRSAILKMKSSVNKLHQFGLCKNISFVDERDLKNHLRKD